MAMGRLNRPSLMIHGGNIKPGRTCLSNMPVDVMSAVQSYGKSMKLGTTPVLVVQGSECSIPHQNCADLYTFKEVMRMGVAS